METNNEIKQREIYFHFFKMLMLKNPYFNNGKLKFSYQQYLIILTVA